MDSATLSHVPGSLARAESGHPAAQGLSPGLTEPFERLFLTEYPRVVRIANRVLANPGEAEEVAQEVFLEFHRRHPADAEYAGPWLHRAAWHRALNVVRGNRRRLSREEATAQSDHAVQDPEGLVQEAVERERVREAMRRLPRKSAAVLALRYSGLSYAEVAGALGVTVGQVGTLLRRAEMKLRSEVQR